MALDNLPEYPQGAFGDCDFDVITVRDSFGHRVSVHEYPERDIPWTESHGRRVRTFRVQAGIWGETHIQDARKLIDKSECGVSETFVHPIFGEFECKLVECNTSHNPEGAGGQTLLDLTFIETGALVFPQITAVQGQNVANALTGYVGVVFGTITFPATTAFDTDLFRFISDLSFFLRGLFNQNIDWNGQSIDVSNDLDVMGISPQTYTGDQYIATVRQSVEALFAFGISDTASLAALCELLSYGLDETGSACEYALYVRLLAAGYAAEAAIQNGYTNPVEAISFMECLIGGLERDSEIAANKCFDEIYAEIQCLITSISQDFTFLALGLPPIIKASLCRSLPSIVAAFEVFGNLDSLEAFEAINSVQDSMFMPNDVLYQAQ